MDNKELFEALTLLEKERGLPADYMVSQIQKAIVIACKNTFGGNEDAKVMMNEDKGTFDIFLYKTVVEEVLDPNREMNLDQAREYDKTAQYGEKVGIPLDPMKFGRIVVQTARSVIRQGIRDGEKGMMLQEFQNRQQEIVTATVERVDPRSGGATLRINKAEAVLPKSEQIADEVLTEGDHVKIYIVEVRDTDRGPKAIISRTHPDFVKRLFESEVPEIYDGTVEIKSVSREAGSRTKLAVYSSDKEVDPVGACIGARGARVGSIVEELGGEKVDIVEYSENPTEFISAALSPANVNSVLVARDGSRACRVTVPDGQLSLAIGNKGQNARLAAKLTGWKIDIRPESGFFGDEEETDFYVVYGQEDKKPVKPDDELLDDEFELDETMDENEYEIISEEANEDMNEEAVEKTVAEE